MENEKNDDCKIKIGDKFGFWKVINKSSHVRSNARWECKCVCGEIKPVYQYSLLNGSSQSCGCSKSMEAIETRKQIRKLLNKGYSQRDILANIYTSTRMICQERKKIRENYLCS